MADLEHKDLKTYHLFDDVEYTQCGRFLPDLAREMGRDDIALWDGQAPDGEAHICHECIRSYNDERSLTDQGVSELCQPQRA